MEAKGQSVVAFGAMPVACRGPIATQLAIPAHLLGREDLQSGEVVAQVRSAQSALGRADFGRGGLQACRGDHLGGELPVKVRLLRDQALAQRHCRCPHGRMEFLYPGALLPR